MVYKTVDVPFDLTAQVSRLGTLVVGPFRQYHQEHDIP